MEGYMREHGLLHTSVPFVLFDEGSGWWCVVLCLYLCVCEEDEETHTHTSLHVVVVHLSLFMFLSTCLCRGRCRGCCRNGVVSSCVRVVAWWSCLCLCVGERKKLREGR